ncbi:E3 ubiquitin-protein ligase TRIM7-like [Trachemys scripta elegans]|uniref:E3 ubiquitin-protein ligase TRIM7-like n=1 Tax=Trachemys scripta elegans TaxID=31138 RepID=UPI001555F662|nr:E3 ubiquitin-protein ligase TRIM7-like [Trachemys scripta elegans]
MVLPWYRPALSLWLQKQTAAERRKIVWEWQELRGFLEEQEQWLLSRLEELERAIAQRRDEGVCSLSRGISLLSERGGDEGQRPPSQPLQAAGSPGSREDGAFPKLELGFAELEKRLCNFSLQSAHLQEVLLGFKETLRLELGSDTGCRTTSAFPSGWAQPPRGWGRESAAGELAEDPWGAAWDFGTPVPPELSCLGVSHNTLLMTSCKPLQVLLSLSATACGDLSPSSIA